MWGGGGGERGSECFYKLTKNPNLIKKKMFFLEGWVEGGGGVGGVG